jgi:hypothetical protein
LLKIHNGAYATRTFEIPDEDFKVRLRGQDSHGVPINREVSSYLSAVNGSAPEVTVESDEFNFCTSEQAELRCKVKSQVPVNVEWTFEGKEVMKGNANQSMELVLKLDTLTLKQQGDYVCTATNKIGNETKRISLSIFEIPKVEIKNKNFTFLENFWVNLECKLEGGSHDDVTVRWVDDQGKVINVSWKLRILSKL